MKCPRCDEQVSEKMRRCNKCGQALEVIKRVYRISNAYYNSGLEKAKVRDLSGAVISLRKSLQYNKKNIVARNLLGLVLCEMGEVVSALSEWVLSKYLQSEENEADYYISLIQNNPTQLDMINQAIKKYNAALTSARTGSGDLAVIQLKKVVTLNPKFIRAYQLLALLLMKERKFAEAKTYLLQARKIDSSNTLTLKYLAEVKRELGEASAQTDARRLRRDVNNTSNTFENIMPVGSYREEKHNWMTFVGVILGVVIGVAIAFVLIRPTILQKAQDENAQKVVDLGNQLSSQSDKVTTLQNDKDDLQKQYDKLKKQLDEYDAQGGNTDAPYEKLLLATQYYINRDTTAAAVCLKDVKKKDMTSDVAKELYTLMQRDVTDSDALRLYSTGKSRYDRAKYDEAIDYFNLSLSVKDDNQDALFFLGRCYQRAEENEKARDYYQKVLDIDDTTSRANDARTYIEQVGGEKTDDEPDSSASPSPSP